MTTAGRKPKKAEIVDVIDPSLDQAKIEGAMVQMRTDATEMALVQAQHDSAVRAVALQLGYLLPADCTDPDLIQRDISANMRRSVEACLEVGRGLTVLKTACGHGTFAARLDVLGIDVNVAGKFMQSARRFSNSSTSMNLTKALGNQSKLFEMLILDDSQIEELELTGQTGELSLDEIATMSVKELRTALREERQEREADKSLLENKNKRIDKLERDAVRIAKMAPDEVLADLKKASTAIMHDASGCVAGQLRQALIALSSHGDERGQQDVFMAGLVGQLQADLHALREEFNLPDVSSAADRELAAEVAQWAKPV
ncbi:MAG: hypothetical protein ABI606_01760 [Rhodoferax sp.]